MAAEACSWDETRTLYNGARAKEEPNSAVHGPAGPVRFVRWHTLMFKRMREVIGGSPVPSWRDFNSRMRESEIANYKYWRSILVAHHPTDNFYLTISNGSDSASTSIIKSRPLHRFQAATPRGRITLTRQARLASFS